MPSQGRAFDPDRKFPHPRQDHQAFQRFFIDRAVGVGVGVVLGAQVVEAFEQGAGGALAGDAAAAEGAEVRLRRAREFVGPDVMALAPGWKESAEAMNAKYEAPTADDAVWADAIIFGSPTYMGSVSWQFKKFADASSKPWYTQAWKDKIFGGFTASANMNGDKHSTIHYFMTLAMQHGGIWAGTGINYNNTKASQRSDLNYLASSAGPMAQTPGDSGADEMNAGDLETGRLFGERMATLAAKFKA